MSSKGIHKKSKSSDATKKLAEKIKKQALLKQKQLQESKESSDGDKTASSSVAATTETTIDPDAELKFNTFAELNLVPDLLEAIQQMKFTKPTPIQSEAIPHALEGKDIIGLAVTGSGKTAALDRKSVV